MTGSTDGDMTEHSGVDDAGLGDGPGVAPGVVQGAVQNISPLAPLPASLAALKDIYQVTSVAAPMLVDVVKPFIAGRTIGTALGISDLVQNNLNRAGVIAPESISAASMAAALTPGIQVASAAATGLASGIRWDLVNAAVAAQAPARSARPSKRRFAATATRHAQQAATIAEFGDALRALREEALMSLNDLDAYAVKTATERGAKIDGLAKATLSSVCQGRRLFQREEQVIHFVTACRAEADVDVWLAAWRRAKKNRGARTHGSGTPPATESQLVTDTSAATESGWWLSGPGDEIVHVIQIPVTRGQVRGAVAAMTVLGLIASSARTPTIRAAGLAALGVAGGVALAGHARGLATA